MAYMEGSTAVQVVVRMRPLNDREKRGNTLPVITANTEKREVMAIKGAGNRQQRTTYHFDRVLGTMSSQEEVFQQTIKGNIPDVLSGFECTMFAYGQTGTGKTHTMEGDLANPDNHGVIPRAAQAIFDQLADPKYCESEVTASYLEIYNEDLADLLVPEGKDQKLMIQEDTKPRGRGTYVANLSEQPVKTASDVLALMRNAQIRRQVGETKMNKQSSRSHCLFTLKVHSKKVVSGDGAMMECTGKLHLVDLAGSESAKTAGDDQKADLARERERKNINQSLLALGNVIRALRQDASKAGRIPYRDSKLTRLLQNALGGNCKTVIIATVSPSVLSVDESISTLKYASEATGIQNKAAATSYLKLGEGQARPGTAAGTGSAAAEGVQDWNQMECRLQYLQSELEEAQAALSKKHLMQQAIIDRAEAAEKEVRTLTETLQVTKDELSQACCRNDALLAHLKASREDVARAHQIVHARAATEDSLTAEAEGVLAALANCVADGKSFHALLTRQADDEAARRCKSRAFCKDSSDMLKALGAELAQYAAEVTVRLKNVVTQSKEVEASSVAQLETVMEAVTGMEAMALEQTSQARQAVADGAAATSEHLSEMMTTSASHGEELKATVRKCQLAVEERMGALQQQVAISEESLAGWSTAASSTLEDTRAQLSRLLQEHTAAAESDQAAAQEQLSAASLVLAEHHKGLQALTADLVAQRGAQAQLAEALSATAQGCAAVAASRVEEARGHAQDLATALAAQKGGQLDSALAETLEQARLMAQANAYALSDLAAAQKASLEAALEQQLAGTISESHTRGIQETQSLVEAACGGHVSQLAGQRGQLEQARDMQQAGNATRVHLKSLAGFRDALVDKMQIEREMLAAQKTGMEKAAHELQQQMVAAMKAQVAQMVSEEQRARAEEEAQRKALAEAAETAARERQNAAAALLEKVLMSQVSQLSTTIGSMEDINAQLSREVEAAGTVVADTSATLEAETAAWGKSNKTVEQIISESLVKNEQLVSNIETMQTEVDAKAQTLHGETMQWHDSNHAVIEKINAIVVENTDMAAAVASGTEAVDEELQRAAEQGQSWGESDRTCQEAMQTVIEGAHALADKMQADQETLHEQQGQANAALAGLSGMTAGSQAAVVSLTSSNDHAQGSLRDLAAAIDQAAADAGTRLAVVETTQTSAHAAMTASVAAMMAPRADFGSGVAEQGQQLLADVRAAVDQTSQLIGAQQERLGATHEKARAASENTKALQQTVLGTLDAGAADLSAQASASAVQTRTAIEAGPLAVSAVADALAVELSSVQEVYTTGAAQLASCVKNHCATVSLMDTEVAPVPELGTFNTAVSFSRTPPDAQILAGFTPVVDMSDMSAPLLQVMSAEVIPAEGSQNAIGSDAAPDDMSTPTPINLDVDGRPTDAEDVSTGTAPIDAAAEKGDTPQAADAAQDSVPGPAEPQIPRSAVRSSLLEKTEKKRAAAVRTPKKSVGKQSMAEKTDAPASKIAAPQGSSRSAVPKSRVGLREINQR